VAPTIGGSLVQGLVHAECRLIEQSPGALSTLSRHFTNEFEQARAIRKLFGAAELERERIACEVRERRNEVVGGGQGNFAFWVAVYNAEILAVRVTVSDGPAALGKISPCLLRKSRPVRLHNWAHEVKSPASGICR
jgi:hypothetical protein